MKYRFAFLILNLALVASSLHAAPFITPGNPAFDPFADATSSNGSPYNVGDFLIGQTNAQGLTWAGAGTSNTFQPKINATNLSVTGLAASSGNAVSFGFASASTGDSGRLGLGGALTSGTIYYSLALDVTGLGTLTTGAIIAGFNNSTGSGPQPTVISTRLEVRTNTLGTGGYNIGLAKGTNATVWDTNVHNTGETVFIVGSYTFITGSTSNDSCSLWINPDPSTFGAASAPTSTLDDASPNDTDISQVASFLLRQGSSLEPNMLADEIRVGVTWADVTPPATVTISPFPILSSSIDNTKTNFVLTWQSVVGVMYQVVGSTNILTSVTNWTNVGSPITATSTNTSATNPITQSQNFFAVKSP